MSKRLYIRDILNQDNLMVFFQPIVDVKNKKVIGLEGFEKAKKTVY